MRTAIITAATVAVLATACGAGGTVKEVSSAGAPSTTRVESGPTTTTTGTGWTPEPLEWTGCGSRECATLSVPLDWEDPDGTQIELAINRRQADGESNGSLLTNPGGPGASGVEFNQNEVFDSDITENFDIVSWDPRGVGDSTALECGDTVDDMQLLDTDPDNAQEQEALDAAAQAVADECSAEDSELLPHVNTNAVAKDLDAIRAALGEEELTYVGFSYGTAIGIEYARLFPDRVRALVLDGVVDPTLDFEGWLRQQTIAFEQSVNRAFEWCDNDSSCPSDDLASTYDSVAATVERNPMATSSGRDLGPAELATAAIFTSYDPSSWAAFGQALVSADDGDADLLMQLADSYYGFGGYTSYAAVVCSDTPHPEGASEFEEFVDRMVELSPRFGGSVGNELAPCAYWDTPAASPPSATIDADGIAPVLVLGNTGDAATPYDNSVKVADLIAGAQLVTYEGEGHVSYGRNSCVNDAVARYVNDLVVPDGDPRC